MKTLQEIQDEMKNTLKVGMKTNFGIFLGFDDKGYASFEKGGWAGPQSFHLIQIREK